MSINYNWIPRFLNLGDEGRNGTHARSGPRKNYVMGLLALIAILAGVGSVNAQALLPTGQGGFEDASGNNGWTFVNSNTNYWVIGTTAGASVAGQKSVYITNNGSAYQYTNNPVTSSYSWFYRDITVPAGQNIATLSYKWKNVGESFNDLVKCYVTPVTSGGVGLVPVADAPIANTAQVIDMSGSTYAQAAYQTVAPTTINSLLCKPGSKFRLIFGWVNNNTLGGPAPASIDEIAVTFTSNGSKTAVASGGWGDAGTWATTATAMGTSFSVPANSKTVTGVGTTFKTLGVGSALFLSDGTTYVGTVASVPTSDTSLTLLANNILAINSSTAIKVKAAPLPTDNVTIPSGITVTQNLTVINTAPTANAGVNLTFNDLTVDGILILDNGGLSNGTLTLTGNLTVTGTMNNSFGKTLGVGGDITNTGVINQNSQLSKLTLNGWQKQTVSGTGNWGSFTSDANAYRVLRSDVAFSNTYTSYPNILWNMGNTVFTGILTFSSGTNRVDMPGVAAAARRVFIGYSKDLTTKTGSITSNNFTNGFYPGVSISKYFAGADMGTTWTTSSVSEANGRFPFVDAGLNSRHVYVGRSTTGATEGDLELKYTDGDGFVGLLDGDATNPTFMDGTYKITQRTKGFWNVSANNGLDAATWSVGADAINGMFPSNIANIRMVHKTAGLAGTHKDGYASLSGGNVNTFANRLDTTKADLTGSALYVGVGAADACTMYSVNGGPWSSSSTWSSNSVPTYSDRVLIMPGHEVFGYNDPGDNVAGSLTIAAGGTLTLPAAGNLIIGSSSAHNSSLVNNGTFNMTDVGANLLVNGYFLSNTGSTFIQTAGTIEINGNDGNVATSVPASTHLFKVLYNPSTINVAGGTIRILNPPIGNNVSSDYALNFTNSATNNWYAFPPSHTIEFGKFGDTSTVSANQEQGFNFLGSATVFGTVIVNNNNGKAGRCAGGVGTTYTAMYDLNILSGGEYRNKGNIAVLRKLTNNGILTSPTTSSTIHMGAYYGSSAISTYLDSKITGGGEFRSHDSSASSLTNIQNLIVNNINGVTLDMPLTMGGSLTMTNGLLNCTVDNYLTMGNSTATVSYPNVLGATGGSSATQASWVNGPLARVYASGSVNTAFYNFPVGNATLYTPFQLAPTTTGITTFKVKYDPATEGTAGSGIGTYTNTNGKWNVTTDIANNTTVSNMHVKMQILLAAANQITGTTIVPVASGTRNGAYDHVYGDLNSLASGVVTSLYPGNYPSGTFTFNPYISYAVPTGCSGTPAPGNTVTTASTFCSGDKVTLSMSANVQGSGVTYQWQSAPDVAGVAGAWANNGGPTTLTWLATPTVSTWYRCNVTCSGNTFASTEVKVSAVNTLTMGSAPDRCGYGTVTLAATANSGATVNWYNTATVGVIGENRIGTNDTTTNTFTTTTPIGTNTIYYAAAETVSTGTYRNLPTYTTAGSLNSNGYMAFQTYSVMTINSFDFVPSTTNTVYFVLAQTADGANSGNILGYSTYTPTQTQVNLGFPVTVTVNFSNIPVGKYMIYANKNATSASGFSNETIRQFSGSPSYPLSLNGIKMLSSYSGYVWYSNWSITGEVLCASTRQSVTATVSTAGSDFALTNTGSPVVSKTGTITTDTSSATVTGASTKFLTELSVGSTLYQWDGITPIGTVQAIATDTSLTLTTNAAVTNATAAAASFNAKNAPLAGTITTATTSNAVTGTSTKFLTQLLVGSTLYKNDGTTVIGTVQAIINDTSLTLTANAAQAVSAVTYRATSTLPSVCKGDPSAGVTIANNAGGYDQFSWSNANGETNPTGSAPWTFTPTTTTTYTLWATKSGGNCGQRSDVTVTVNPLPNTFVVQSATNNVCANDLATVALTHNYAESTVPTAWWPHGGQGAKSITAPTLSGLPEKLSNQDPNQDNVKYVQLNVLAGYKYVFQAGSTPGNFPSAYWTVMDATGTNPLAGSMGGVTYISNTATTIRVYNYCNISGDTSCFNVFQWYVTATPLPQATWTSTAAIYSTADAQSPYVAGTPAKTVYVKHTAVNTSATYTAKVTLPTTSCFSTVDKVINTIPATSTITFYRDADGDGWGNPNVTTVGCSKPVGYVFDNTDCDDTPVSGANKHQTYPFYVDNDHDNHGTGTAVQLCAANASPAPFGYSTNNDDYADDDAGVWRSEVMYVDADGDHYTVGPPVTLGYGTTSHNNNGYYFSSLGEDCNDHDNTKLGGAFSLQPQSISMCSAAGTATLTAVVSGTGLTKQWQKLVGTVWTNVTTGATGMNTTSLVLTATPANLTKYRLVVTGGACGTLISNVATVTVTTTYVPLAITPVWGKQTGACYGTMLTLTCAAGKTKGNVQMEYAYFDGNVAPAIDSSEWKPLGSVQSGSLTATNGVITRTITPDAGKIWFRTVASWSACGGTVYSAAAGLAVNSGVAAGNADVSYNGSHNGVVCAGVTVRLSLPGADLTGGARTVGTVVTTWYKSTSYTGSIATTKWTAAGVGTGADCRLDVPALATTWYYANIVNGSCNSQSTVVNVTVTPTALAGKIVAGKTVCKNDNIMLTASPIKRTGNHFKWEVSTDQAAWFEIGGDADFVTVGGTYTATAGSTFYVRYTISSTDGVNGLCSSSVSSAAAVKVDFPTVSGSAFGGGLVCANSPVPLAQGKLTVKGNTGKYFQWQYSTAGESTGFVNVPASLGGLPFTSSSAKSTTNSYIVTTVTQDIWFRAVVANGACGSETTGAVKFDTGERPELTQIGSSVASGNVCAGVSAYLTADGFVGSGIKWQLSINGGSFADIALATKTAYTTPKLANTTATPISMTYKAIALIGDCDFVAKTITFTVYPTAKATAVTGNLLTGTRDGSTALKAICLGGSNALGKILTLTSGYVGTIEWQTLVNGSYVACAGIANQQNYTVSAPVTGLNTFRVKLVSGPCTVMYTSPFKVYYDATCSTARTMVEETAVTPFAITAYPNPYSETFRLNVATTSDARVGFMVYDMTGRLLDQREATPSEISTMTFGDRYPAGIYNVIVTQGTEVETLRMVKR